MTKEEILHLARLSRIALSPEDVATYEGQLSSILEYVSAVNAIAAEGQPKAPEAGTHFNVFRRDEVTNAPEAYTESLLAAMPQREGRFLKVKKILQQQDE